LIPKEILKKVKNIEIRTKGLVNELFGGEYHSVFKGQGMTFSEVREYSPGDDIRLIDWNVTARNNGPFVKIFEEERELTVYLIVDISASGDFGTINQLKSEIIAEIAAIISFSAIKNKDKVGLILFSEDIEKYIPPKKDKSHVLRVIREILYYKPAYKKTNISSALDFLMRVSNRKSVIFLISDFLDDEYWKSLRMVNRKHDLIGIKVKDPAEKKFPNIGLMNIYNEETNEEYWINSNSSKEREQLALELQKESDLFISKCKKNKFDLIDLDAGEDYISPLISYFRNRDKK